MGMLSGKPVTPLYLKSPLPPQIMYQTYLIFHLHLGKQQTSTDGRAEGERRKRKKTKRARGGREKGEREGGGTEETERGGRRGREKEKRK